MSAERGSRESHQSVVIVEIDAELASQRLDNFLMARLKGVPRSRIYRILRKGEVRVNRSRCSPDYRLQAGDLVRIPPVRVAERPPVATPGGGLRRQLTDAILYEDDCLLVIDKPHGLAVHGGSGVSLGLIEALRAMWPHEKHLELVHRLDRDTSGCILVARRRSALRTLQRDLQGEDALKRYQLLVAGKWSRHRAEVDMPLRKNQLASGERMVRPDVNGQRAVTRFRLLEALPGASLLEATLATGRTHQIRVHCQASGHPLAGDGKYGDEEFNRRLRSLGLDRMFLHAWQLRFPHPVTREPIEVEAPLPDRLLKVVQRLREEP